MRLLVFYPIKETQETHGLMVPPFPSCNIPFFNTTMDNQSRIHPSIYLYVLSSLSFFTKEFM